MPVIEWIGISVGVAGVAIAAVAWLRPRAPKPPSPAVHETLRVSKAWAYPTWTDSEHRLSTLIQVTLNNGTERRVQVTGWGLRTPDGSQLISPRPLPFDPSLPHWVEAASGASWHLVAREVTEILSSRGLTYEDLTSFVHLADGRTITG